MNAREQSPCVYCIFKRNSVIGMKKFMGFKIVGIILGVILLFELIINVIPPKKVVKNNPFIVGKNKLPMIAAHRGGKSNAPENTMLAFKKAVYENEVDVIEADIYMTKDNKLVLHHNSYIDENCDVNGDIEYEIVAEVCKNPETRCLIENMTLEELKQYNFGYYFKNSEGERIYKDVKDLANSDLQITTVEELFEEFYQKNPDLLFILEIKNGGESGIKACELLDEILNKYPNYMKNITIGSFHNEVENELKSRCPELLNGASEKSATSFVLTHFFGVNLFDKSNFACLQIPTAYNFKGKTVHLDSRSLIKRAHRKNIAVQYWTINEADEMRKLIELGCDCIMTDNPELLKEVLSEYK